MLKYRCLIVVAVLLIPETGVAENEPRLELPVGCELGRTCFIQNYVDRDPSSAARDFTCGSMTYDGHNGTDFRIPSMLEQRAGVDVLAAADGEVIRKRDGVPDVSVRERGRETVEGAECGNGIVIQHGADWNTQYCHMASGSIQVEPGQKISAGQVIGRIGLSGLTEYPHLHFTVRNRGLVIDPFDYGSDGRSCKASESLWTGVMATTAYQGTKVLNAGFATESITNAAIESGTITSTRVATGSPGIVAYIRAIGLQAGDKPELIVKDPSGEVFSTASKDPLDRPQTQYVLFSGKRRTSKPWALGRYTATFQLRRGSVVALRHDFYLDLIDGALDSR